MNGRWLRTALRLYPREWRTRYEREVVDLADELMEQKGRSDARIAFGLLLHAPRAWLFRRRPRALRYALVAGVFTLTAVGAGLAVAVAVVPANPAASAPFRVASGAMAPTLQRNQVVQVQQLTATSRISQGEIVVFRRPAAENCGGPGATTKYLVKRIVGLPGQTISLSDGYVVIDGRKLAEGWLPQSVLGMTEPGPSGTPYSLERPFLIPAHSYYVLGDNRVDSCDSRYWGPVSRSLLYGQVAQGR
jgi:signal peptidase I